jgi:hypothetical protein
MDMGMFKQEGWIDGVNVWVKFGELQKLEGSDAEQYLLDATMFKDAALIERGYQCKVLGKQGNLILMSVVSLQGKKSTYYFDSDTYLINKIEMVVELPQGKIPFTESYKNYISIEGVKLPGTIETSSSLYSTTTINKYVVNVEMDDSQFTPEK